MLEQGKEKRPVSWLYKACSPETINLADELSDQELSALAQEVVRSHKIDRDNRADWDRQMERALKLAKQILEKKTTPFEGAANVKHPLITVATIQFAARAYPEICKTGKVVKTVITGDDPAPKPPPQPAPAPGQQPPPGAAPHPAPAAAGPPGQNPPQMAPPPGAGVVSPEQQMQAGMAQMTMESQPQVKPSQQGPKRQRADRIEAHMNWQLTQEQSDWEADMDSLLHVLPVAGQVYKKSYFSSELKHNVSELVLPDDCVVSKGKGRDIKTAQRITHRLWIYENDAVEKMKNGTWREISMGPAPSTDNDIDAPHEFLEQHRWWDLDGDGYKEPYIVTVHKETTQTVRVAARFVADGVRLTGKGHIGKIAADHYFTHYGFIPNPDGSMNSLGFGQLLEPINAAANSVLNQLLDSGKIYNAGGGFIGRGPRMRGGVFKFAPGTWFPIDTSGGALKDNMIPNPVREPSMVMFQLLGFLITAGKEISSVQDILTGADSKLTANIPVGTMMAFVEQGLKVYVAIYKRIYRSLTEEFRKLYILNSRFLEPKVTFQISGHPEQFVEQSDYLAGDTSVMPMADPELSSDMQRMLKSQALKEISGRPGLNEIEVTRRSVWALHPEDVEELLLTDDELSGKVIPRWKPPPPPQQILAQAKAVRMQQQAQEAMARLQMDAVKFQFELEEIREKIANVKADTIVKLAKAEDLSSSDYLESYKLQMDKLGQETELKAKMMMEQIKQIGLQQKGASNATGG